jgi:hypothetical protein
MSSIQGSQERDSASTGGREILVFRSSRPDEQKREELMIIYGEVLHHRIYTIQLQESGGAGSYREWLDERARKK